MTAKQWLSRARFIDREITKLLDAKDAVKARVLSITPSYSGEPVQGTRDPHKFDKLVELEDTIDTLVDKLVDTKREIITGISRLEDGRHREVLYARYIENKTFEEIAVGVGYSIRQVWRLHGEALLRMEVIIRDMVV